MATRDKPATAENPRPPKAIPIAPDPSTSRRRPPATITGRDYEHTAKSTTSQRRRRRARGETRTRLPCPGTSFDFSLTTPR